MEYVFETEAEDIVEIGEDEEEIVDDEEEIVEEIDDTETEEEEIFPIRRKTPKKIPVFQGPPLRPEK